jgi:hypothetical protein
MVIAAAVSLTDLQIVILSEVWLSLLRAPLIFVILSGVWRGFMRQTQPKDPQRPGPRNTLAFFNPEPVFQQLSK